jgi:hypothetical protein
MITTKDTALVVIDVQEKLVPAMNIGTAHPID